MPLRLPVTIVIFNNGGIYNGVGEPMDKTSDPAPTTLDIHARYDLIGQAFGAQPYYVQTPDELAKALTESIASKKPCIIDVQARCRLRQGIRPYRLPQSGSAAGYQGIKFSINAGGRCIALGHRSCFSLS